MIYIPVLYNQYLGLLHLLYQRPLALSCQFSISGYYRLYSTSETLFRNLRKGPFAEIADAFSTLIGKVAELVRIIVEKLIEFGRVI